MKSRMYKDVQTWNPFKGCLFDCLYCKPSFQLQAKRQKQNCTDCYNYKPHYHPERLNDIPNADTIFVCGNADIAFCDLDFVLKIIDSIKTRNKHHPEQTYYLQSKNPRTFERFHGTLPENAILLTTLETNRIEGYHQVSYAPPPNERWHNFRHIGYPRKVVTIEPVMDFDIGILFHWVRTIEPEYVWLGFNSHPKQSPLPEPSKNKVAEFMEMLKDEGIEVRGKELRGLTLDYCQAQEPAFAQAGLTRNQGYEPNSQHSG